MRRPPFLFLLVVVAFLPFILVLFVAAWFAGVDDEAVGAALDNVGQPALVGLAVICWVLVLYPVIVNL